MNRPGGLVLAGLVLGATLAAQRDAPYLGPPVRYEEPAVGDPIARLQTRLQGGLELSWDERRGWLPALLDALDIDVSTQTLVFSKTSFQLRRISPTTPRAVFFGDDAYVGWVPGAPVLEVTSMDPEKGPMFFVVPQDRAAGLRFEREDARCLQCHASPRTDGWPAHIVRSVHPDADGQPILRAGSYVTSDASPLAERWGGDVTGTHGDQRHLGNVVVDPDDPDEQVDPDRGANVTDLSGRIDVGQYPTPHSDIVALMVLEHQTTAQNVLARARYEALLATHRAAGMPGAAAGEAAAGRLDDLADEVIRALLLCDTLRLDAPIRGTSDFSSRFAKRGPHDQEGRTLRELDLDARLFRYPLSYVVYSPSFDALPPALLERVRHRLLGVLEGTLRPNPFRRITRRVRHEVLAILRDTKPDLWRE